VHRQGAQAVLSRSDYDTGLTTWESGLDSLLQAKIFVLRYRVWYPSSGYRERGEVVSLTCRPPFTPQEDPRYSFLLEAESTPGPECGWKD
jgi:hypothetical protein